MSIKKWATKKEISDLLKTYSIRSDEFEPFGDEGCSFKSKFARGYVISIEPEIQHGNVETGRIIISHTKSNGKRTFHDVWERGLDGNLHFAFRNPWNETFTDYDYVREIEDWNIELENTMSEMRQQLKRYQQLIDNTEHSQEGLYQMQQQELNILKVTNKHLQNQITSLTEKMQKLINKTEHNARGAGRKADPQHLKEQVAKVQSLLEEGKSISEIQQIMGISRSSYFRYKKLIK